MDGAGAHQVGAVVGVEAVHVGDVLEVVGVQLTLLHGGVGHDVVIKLRDFQGVALFGQDFLGHFQDFGVGGGGGAHLDGLAVGLAGAGAQRQHQENRQRQGDESLFHCLVPLFFLLVWLIRRSVFTQRAVPMD